MSGCIKVSHFECHENVTRFMWFDTHQVIAFEVDPRMVAELQKRVQGTYVYYMFLQPLKFVLCHFLHLYFWQLLVSTMFISNDISLLSHSTKFVLESPMICILSHHAFRNTWAIWFCLNLQSSYMYSCSHTVMFLTLLLTYHLIYIAAVYGYQFS